LADRELKVNLARPLENRANGFNQQSQDKRH
jgi:hypothetical protein